MSKNVKWLEQRHQWHYNHLSEKAMQSLERNNFTTHFFPTSEDAREGILKMIPEGSEELGF